MMSTTPQRVTGCKPSERARAWLDFENAMLGGNLTRAAHLPEFLILGPHKTGTTWLFENLAATGAVEMPATKETHYFSFNWRHFSLEAFEWSFELDHVLPRGEATPSTCALPDPAIEALARLKPDLRVVFLLREPWQRLWSHLKHQARHGEGAFHGARLDSQHMNDATWLSAAQHPYNVAFSDYAGMISTWLRHLGPERIFIGFTDEIASANDDFIARLTKFLGLVGGLNWDRERLRARIFAGDALAPSAVVEAGLRTLTAEPLAALARTLRKFDLAVPSSWQGPLVRAAAPKVFGFDDMTRAFFGAAPQDPSTWPMGAVLDFDGATAPAMRLWHVDGWLFAHWRSLLWAVPHKAGQPPPSNQALLAAIGSAHARRGYRLDDLLPL